MMCTVDGAIAAQRSHLSVKRRAKRILVSYSYFAERSGYCVTVSVTGTVALKAPAVTVTFIV
jgi:hypothetical protein